MDAGDSLDPTLLHQRWTIDKAAGTGASMQAPLVAGGRVFTMGTDTVDGGADLYAFDASTGAQDWFAPVESGGGFAGTDALAYGGGQIYHETGNDVLTAYAAATGKVTWSIALSQTFSGSPPSAYDGVVYVNGTGGGGTLYAVSEATGQLMWSAGVENGDVSIPSVDDTGVYVDFACNLAYGFDLDGTSRWVTSAGCEGGGGATAPLADGRVYLRDSVGGDTAVNATDGSTAGTFAGSVQPAVDAGHLYEVNGGSLVAVDPSGSPGIWSFRGDGDLSSSPVVAGGTSGSTVFEGSSSGTVYGVDASTGLQTWTAAAVTGASGTPALTAADGLLFVAAGGTLTAYGD